jgi:hypothetical protein
MFKTPLAVEPAKIAVTVTAVEALTLPLVTVTFAVMFPAGIVMFVGAGNAELLELARPTSTPPAGAGPLSETDTLAGDPLLIVVGLIVTLAKLEAAVEKLKKGLDHIPNCRALRACTSQ